MLKDKEYKWKRDYKANLLFLNKPGQAALKNNQTWPKKMLRSQNTSNPPPHPH